MLFPLTADGGCVVAQVVVRPRSRMTSGEPIVDRLLVGRAIVNPLGLSPRQYVARKARDCRRRARELRLQLERHGYSDILWFWS